MKKDNGIVLLSLTLILPILIFLFLVIGDYLIILNKTMNMSNFVREIGNNVYRSCIKESTKVNTELCMTEKLIQFNNYVNLTNSPLNGANFTVKLWKVNSISDVELFGEYSINNNNSNYNDTNIKDFDLSLRPVILTVEGDLNVYFKSFGNYNKIIYQSVVF